MPNDPTLERIRSAEQHAIAACKDAPVRLAAIVAHIRAATNNPQFPEAEILTAITNLSDLAKLLPRTIDGCLHYATPATWQTHDKPKQAPHA